MAVLQPPLHRPLPLLIDRHNPEILKLCVPLLELNLSSFSQNKQFLFCHCQEKTLSSTSFILLLCLHFSLSSKSLPGLTGEIFLQICAYLQSPHSNSFCPGTVSSWSHAESLQASANCVQLRPSSSLPPAQM